MKRFNWPNDYQYPKEAKKPLDELVFAVGITDQLSPSWSDPPLVLISYKVHKVELKTGWYEPLYGCLFQDELRERGSNEILPAIGGIKWPKVPGVYKWRGRLEAEESTDYETNTYWSNLIAVSGTWWRLRKF